MKFTLAFMIFLGLSVFGTCQNAPKPADPCQKLDTNTIKKLLLGIWVEVKDSTHVMVITTDSVEETITITMNGKPSTNQSFWNYKFTDNIFSTDDVTCYSLREYKEGYDRHVDLSINSIDSHYLLIGSTGKTVYRRKG